MADGSGGVWARDWLEIVDAARRSIEYEVAAAAQRRDRVMSMPDPLGHGSHGKGGMSDPTARIAGVVDAEAEAARSMPYARDRLAEFDEMCRRVRASCVGPVSEGTYAAELRYRLGKTQREAAQLMGCSRSTLNDRLATLADYLDFIGPARAFGDAVEGDDGAPGPRARRTI